MTGENESARIPLIESVGRALEIMAPMVGRLLEYEWEGAEDDHMWPTYSRSLIVRQFEAMKAIVSLAKVGQGHFGVTLLRPAYEEMLWSMYLKTHSDKANRIALLLTWREIGETLDAQNQYLGAKIMEHYGFTQRDLKASKIARQSSLNELKTIGRELGWRNDEPPGAAALARATGKEREYNFIYHATSKFVHFSTHELARRIWGEKGKVKIGSDSFSRYWSDFALYWSFRIFLDVLLANVEAVNDEDDSENYDELLRMVDAMYPVPIITQWELKSW